MTKLRQRLQREEGFTLIELLIVLVIIGILLAIAVPSYLGFKNSANQKAAASDVRAAIPDAEAFYSDKGTYTGMTLSKLRSSYDPAIKLTSVVLSPAGTSYCLRMDVGGKEAQATRGATLVSSGNVRQGASGCGTVAN